MTRSPYIVGPLYDGLFFLGAPLLALGAGALASIVSPQARDADAIGGSGLVIGVLIHAHLIAVFVRSHGNRSIFALHPIRFLVVPVALFALLLASEWLATAALIVATFWDVWHSGAQTFGLARIYDRNAGVPPREGRRSEFVVQQVLYAGPILAGATLADHLVVLEELEPFADPFSTFLLLVPADVEGHAGTLARIVVVGGALVVALYVAQQVRAHRRGKPVSRLRIVLVASTAITSILAWGFNPWGQAFLIMNAFHAVQYLALIWAVENRRLTVRLRLAHLAHGRALALAIYLAAVVAYGLAVELVADHARIFWALTMVVSLMHFWYDAFIWSVGNRQI